MFIQGLFEVAILGYLFYFIHEYCKPRDFQPTISDLLANNEFIMVKVQAYECFKIGLLLFALYLKKGAVLQDPRSITFDIIINIIIRSKNIIFNIIFGPLLNMFFLLNMR
jgi:hypothetical protein